MSWKALLHELESITIVITDSKIRGVMLGMSYCSLAALWRCTVGKFGFQAQHDTVASTLYVLAVLPVDIQSYQGLLSALSFPCLILRSHSW